MSHLRRLLPRLAPDVVLMSSFVLAWLAPGLRGAATAEDCRSVMILEGLSILAAVLDGGYRETALAFFPLVVAGWVVWLFASGLAGLSWVWLGFVWHVVQAFNDGMRAHRGEYGLARENPDHPHRRYDRQVFLYVGTAAAFPLFWILGRPAHWAIWGTLYFALSAAIETVLRDWFDRIPQGVLRRLKKRLRDQGWHRVGRHRSHRDLRCDRIRLKSGKHLDADLVVTATGLNLKVFGRMSFSVDGKPVDAPSSMIYKGLMVSGVPNLAFAVGYTNASWTLKADLTAQYVGRLLAFMDKHGYTYCVPERDPGVAEEPLMNFTSGYVQRSIGQFPKQGAVRRWKLFQNYALDLLIIRHSKIDDRSIRFG